MQISVIDVEAREKIYAYVILHDGIFHIYSHYGIDEVDLRNFLVMHDLDIDYEIVDRLYMLNRLDDILVGWNITFDLRMIEKDYGYLLSTIEFSVIDMYREIMKITGEAYTLGRYVYEHYGESIGRYSSKYKPEKMYRYLKCIVDVYYTNKIYEKYKDRVEIKEVFLSEYTMI